MKIIRAVLDASVSNLTFAIAPLKRRKLILCYHRLGGHQKSAQSLFHNPVQTTPIEEFERQMQWLSSFCQFKTLDELYNPTDVDNAWQVAITFDDGYRDNLESGLKVFSKYGIPVTLFTATAYNEDPARIPWWDLCSYLSNNQEINGLKEALLESGECADWCLNVRSDSSFNQKLCEELTRLNTCGPYHEAVVFNQLVNRVLGQISGPLQNDMLRPEELRSFSESPLVSIGSHTHTHPNLSLLTESEQEAELEQSFLSLSQWNITTSNWFAYPFGKSRHYTADTRKLLKKFGIKAAVTTHADYVKTDSEHYDIPRISVDGRWSLNTFKARTLAGPILKSFQQKLKI